MSIICYQFFLGCTCAQVLHLPVCTEKRSVLIGFVFVTVYENMRCGYKSFQDPRAVCHSLSLLSFNVTVTAEYFSLAGILHGLIVAFEDSVSR